MQPSVRERRAYEHGVQQARLAEVGQEGALPGEQGWILHASDRPPHPAVPPRGPTLI